jgi:hypothetical protein
MSAHHEECEVSEKAIALVQYTSGLTLAEYGVLISIASLADKNAWRCRASLSMMAAISNVERKTAVRAVQRLTSPYRLPDLRPLVRRVETSTRRVSNIYELNVEFLRELKQKRKRSVRRTQGKTRRGGVPITPLQRAVDTDLDDLFRDIGTNPSTSARRLAKKCARALRQELEDLSPESLTDLAEKIAVKHPRSRLRNWTQLDVGQTDREAIFEAMAAEAQKKRVDMAKAGRMMLGLLDAWDDIPREKWHLVAEIPKFYQRGDYRLEPKKLSGIDLQDHPSQGRTVRSITGPDRVEPSPSLFPRRGRTEVLPKPSDPARIQWPRRSR